MKVAVGHHDVCFDGIASAALFTVLHRAVAGAGHDYEYVGLVHGPDKSGGPKGLSGDATAIVDYRFFPGLDWWFDHHRTAFERPGDEDAFRAGAAGKPWYWDPDEKSCAMLIARTGREKYGVDWSRHEELIERAHVFDGALFATAEEAADVSSPAARIRMVIEGGRDHALRLRILRGFVEGSIADVANLPEVKKVADRLAEVEVKARAIVESSGAAHGPKGEVVVLDLVGRIEEGFSKFHSYAAYPKAHYMISILGGAERTKIGIGFSPWCGAERTHDVSAICRRFGGGGHPVVGAITLPPGQADRARRLVDGIVSELLGGAPATA